MYWFKAKRYGLGWYPSSWQGYLMLLGFLVLVFANVFRIIILHFGSQRSIIEIISETLLLIEVLTIICYKTGEPLRWRWGSKKK